jgi:hypothetical protein
MRRNVDFAPGWPEDGRPIPKPHPEVPGPGDRDFDGKKIRASKEED